MRTSGHGIAVMHYFESCKLQAYPDPATGGEPWTIGWGHTGKDVVRGLKWTQAQADAAFIADLGKFERGVEKLVKVGINQGQFDALVSFAYNVGLANLESSTLLRLVNACQFDAAAVQFARWNKANGKVMKGLTRRRAAEACLFQGMGGADAISKGVKAA